MNFLESIWADDVLARPFTLTCHRLAIIMTLQLPTVSGMFWKIALSHNMASFYIVSPMLVFTMYKFAPNQQFASLGQRMSVSPCHM